MSNENITQKIWNLCHILRGDGISYHEYISELTYLLFLKIAEENKTEEALPGNCRWRNLVNYQGPDLLTEYRDMLTYLGGHASSEIVRKIYAFPTTVFSHSENLRAVINGITKLDWHSLNVDNMGDIYEGLLAKNSQDARSGAGQYFTPRALVDSIVRCIKPNINEVIQDPATGSGGFLISSDQYIRKNNSHQSYINNPPKFEGIEIEKGTYRICLMNSFLHQMNSNLILGDALTTDADLLSPADVIVANPPFGAKAGSARRKRSDISSSANKQLAFLQHIYNGLKPQGRAAVVLPDNVLFEDGVGKEIRQELMSKCNLHAILRLPVGIFYSQGVNTNVLFFNRVTVNNENTKSVLFYDMRSSSAKFGKKRQLSSVDFEDFENTYNRWLTEGQIEEESESSRAKVFTRQMIADRNDNLDILWLESKSQNQDDSLSDPEEIAGLILNYLREAADEIKNISDELQADELNSTL